ncbi:phage portal protein [Mesorhizobium sp. BE184]|uniref:phage portal protein n=1 Tax=Mesorhizobium sp. BE184 TaxID=2817714 RepID=UPI00286C5D99|nr:phage portal protein [Mesorhizobium sp. BE184]
MTSRTRSRQQKKALVPINMTEQQAAEKDRRLRLQDGGAWAAAFGYDSGSGKTVTTETAMRLATFWACVRVTAQAVSCLPAAMYDRIDDNDRERVDDDLAEVICESPNEDQTPLEFWEGNVAWLLTDGNAYSERVEYGKRLVALQPMASNHTKPIRKPDGTLVYRFHDRGKTEDLPRDKVFHIKGFGFGGDVGLSAIRYGAQTFGTALAGDEVSSRLLGSGLSAGGLLKSEYNLTDDQKADLRSILEEHIGSPNTGKLLMLPKGITYERLQLDPVDAELLAQKNLSIEEICRWTGTPPIIIGHAAQGQTMWGTGVQQILLTWLALGIDPICDRIEARVKKQLIRPTGDRRRYFEFNREAMMQMDSAAKAAFLSTAVQNGLMTRNEGRAKLNLSKMPGGEMLTAQTNLAPLEKLGGEVNDGAQARAAMRAWLLDQVDQKDKEAA